jgi:hypothetical protein
MEFLNFRNQMQSHIASMLKNIDHLFVVDVSDKAEFNNRYLDSFPAGTNEIFRERREYDCSACRHFIKAFGNVVAIKDSKIITIWDFDAGEYQPVADAMAAFVKSCPVTDVFVTDESSFGVDYNDERKKDADKIRWHHFYVKLPQKFVIGKRGTTIDTVRGRFRDTCHVFQRSLAELTEDSVLTVLELTAQNSLYKGEEWVPVLRKFLEYKKAYERIPEAQRNLFCWENSVKAGDVIGRIRNHSIGTLLTDISTGVDLNEAVAKYEAMVAPANYKRPKAIYTQKMIDDAKKQIAEMGLMDSLQRRYATLDDITVNNILFANRDAASRMTSGKDVFDQMSKVIPVNPKSFDRVEEVPILTFVKDVLPTAENIEILLEGKHSGNMVSLIAPQVKDSKTMFKWENNFAWAYAGNMTDSMKERVKAAGGKVDGVLRFSIQWNDEEYNGNDFDAHCVEPHGNEIFYRNKVNPHTLGNLDVDIIDPKREIPAVENITWPSVTRMQEGDYRFFVHNFNHRGGRSGFKAEIEFDGQIFAFEYNRELRQDERVEVGIVRYSRKDGFSMIKCMDSRLSSRDIWNLKTNQFYPVTVVMKSPNYWDGQLGIGNLHYFFMLKGCVNPESPNGFFNEFLQNDLMAHKRVFEALGSMMRVKDTEDQLSGLGFSSTQRGSLICKIDGRVSRTVKIVF